MDQPISSQTSHHFLPFSLETNNASTSPRFEETIENGPSPIKMCASSDESKLVSVGDRAFSASFEPSACYRKVPMQVAGGAPTVRELLRDRENHRVLQNEELSGIDRLKRYREEVAGQTLVPEKWSQESLLKEWMDYSSFDKLLAPSGLDLAREALIAEGRRAKSQRLRVESSC